MRSVQLQYGFEDVFKCEIYNSSHNMLCNTVNLIKCVNP